MTTLRTSVWLTVAPVRSGQGGKPPGPQRCSRRRSGFGRCPERPDPQHDPADREDAAEQQVHDPDRRPAGSCRARRISRISRMTTATHAEDPGGQPVDERPGGTDGGAGGLVADRADGVDDGVGDLARPLRGEQPMPDWRLVARIGAGRDVPPTGSAMGGDSSRRPSAVIRSATRWLGRQRSREKLMAGVQASRSTATTRSTGSGRRPAARPAARRPGPARPSRWRWPADAGAVELSHLVLDRDGAAVGGRQGRLVAGRRTGRSGSRCADARRRSAADAYEPSSGSDVKRSDRGRRAARRSPAPWSSPGSSCRRWPRRRLVARGVLAGLAARRSLGLRAGVGRGGVASATLVAAVADEAEADRGEDHDDCGDEPSRGPPPRRATAAVERVSGTGRRRRRRASRAVGRSTGSSRAASAGRPGVDDVGVERAAPAVGRRRRRRAARPGVPAASGSAAICARMSSRGFAVEVGGEGVVVEGGWWSCHGRWTSVGVGSGSRPRWSAMRGPAPGDAGADGAGRDVEHLGDLGVVERAQVAEHDGGPELGGERGQRGVDVEAGGDLARRRRPCRSPARRPSSASIGGDRAPSRGGAARRGRRWWRPGTPRWRTRPARRSGARPRTMAMSASWVASSGVGVVAGDAPAHGVDPIVVVAQQRVERRSDRRPGAASTSASSASLTGRIGERAPGHGLDHRRLDLDLGHSAPPVGARAG